MNILRVKQQDGTIVDIPIGKGADGQSPTHSWNGTVLSITSASGTSSVDLQGEVGPRGSSGVYVGSGEMPEDCNVQIDPEGNVIDIEGLKVEIINVHNTDTTAHQDIRDLVNNIDISGDINNHDTDESAHQDIRDAISNISIPIESVNGQTGAVNLTVSDIGAAPAYSYGTVDLTPGVSELETGKLYFVYV